MSAPYPIHLHQVLFTRSSVLAIPGYKEPEDGTSPAISPENNLEVTPIDDKPHHFIAKMRSTINMDGSPQAPYSIDMECIATLQTDGSLSKSEELKGVMINAHSVCYGAIREAVSWITSRQPYGAVSLGLSVLSLPTAAAEKVAKHE